MPSGGLTAYRVCLMTLFMCHCSMGRPLDSPINIISVSLSRSVGTEYKSSKEFPASEAGITAINHVSVYPHSSGLLIKEL